MLLKHQKVNQKLKTETLTLTIKSNKKRNLWKTSISLKKNVTFVVLIRDISQCSEIIEMCSAVFSILSTPLLLGQKTPDSVIKMCDTLNRFLELCYSNTTAQRLNPQDFDLSFYVLVFTLQ